MADLAHPLQFTPEERELIAEQALLLIEWMSDWRPCGSVPDSSWCQRLTW